MSAQSDDVSYQNDACSYLRKFVTAHAVNCLENRRCPRRRSVVDYLRYHMTGPASLAEQISSEHGCSILLLVPLYRLTPAGPPSPHAPGSRSLDVDACAPLQAETTVRAPSPPFSHAPGSRPLDIDVGAPLQADTSGPPHSHAPGGLS